MLNNKLQNKNRKGFTIVETLVAITILMIAIAGPLTVASKGLLAAVYAHDQMTASYLAQDAMEYIKNVRDNNVINGLNFTNYFDSCVQNTPCAINTLNGNTAANQSTLINSTLCDNGCYLYNNGNGYYPASSGTKKTRFSRKFYITATDNANEVKATVSVEWKNGTVSNSVVLTNQLFNILK